MPGTVLRHRLVLGEQRLGHALDRHGQARPKEKKSSRQARFRLRPDKQKKASMCLLAYARREGRNGLN
jgi:hypothetical protein